MCNLYSVTKGQQAIRDLTRAMRDTTGNLPPMPAVFPDYAAPIVRNLAEGGRELTLMRWGFPPPPNPRACTDRCFVVLRRRHGSIRGRT
jgi:putative SOS response-associated peptidase YedK